jgi:hypothetical protein
LKQTWKYRVKGKKRDTYNSLAHADSIVDVRIVVVVGMNVAFVITHGVCPAEERNEGVAIPALKICGRIADVVLDCGGGMLV